MTAALTAEQEESLQDLTSTQLESIKRRAKTDLFFLAKAILGYDQLEIKAHAALCAFLTREEATRRMVLMSRGFLKSTICTISDSIRLALASPETTRILIANENEENATGFLKELKAHWTNGGLLPQLFPELVPPRTTGPGCDWSVTHASIVRSSVYKESTWMACGVGGSVVSKHFSTIKCDDLVGRRAKGSPTEMQNTTNWTKDLHSLLDRLDCTLDFYGTRKSIGDTYEYLMERWPSMAVFTRDPLENGETIFSKMPTEELLKVMTETPEEWAADYMNNPIGQGGTDWGPSFISYFTLINRVIRFTDPLKGTAKSWKLHELDIVITVDPNSGKRHAPDKAAICVHGVSPDDEIFVLSSRAERWSPDELINEIWADCIKWSPRIVGIEDAGQQNTMYYFEKKCIEQGQHFSLFPLKHKNQEKEKRVRTALDTPLKSKRIFFLRTQMTLVSQVQFFPQLATHNWDEIDALSNGAQLYRAGMNEKDLEEQEEAASRILQLRGVTGYGNSICRVGLQ